MPTQHIPASTAAIRTTDLYTSYLYQIKSHRRSLRQTCWPTRRAKLRAALYPLPYALLSPSNCVCRGACQHAGPLTTVLRPYAAARSLANTRQHLLVPPHPTPPSCQASHAGPPGAHQVRPSSPDSQASQRASAQIESVPARIRPYQGQSQRAALAGT